MSSPLVKENRVAAGLKAAIHNPNVSAEAKERAQERLENMGVPDEISWERAYLTGTVDASGHEANRVLGGYKATLHSTCVPCCRSETRC